MTTDNSLYQILVEGLISGGIEHIAKAAYGYLKRPFIVTDAVYNILAQFPNETIDDFVWDTIFDNDSIPLNIIHLLSDEQLIKKGYETNKPFYINWGIFEKHPRILSNIVVDGSVVGYSATLYLNEPCTEQDLIDIELINKVISIEFQRKHINKHSTENIQALFFQNLLEGKIKHREDLNLWKSNFTYKFTGDYYILAAESSKGRTEVLSLPYVKKNFTHYYPMFHVVIVDERLYVLITNLSNKKATPNLKSLSRFLIKYDLKIGMSYIFSMMYTRGWTQKPKNKL